MMISDPLDPVPAAMIRCQDDLPERGPAVLYARPPGTAARRWQERRRGALRVAAALILLAAAVVCIRFAR